MSATGTRQERDHKRFSPSRSERFILCPGSVNLLDRVPPRGPTSYSLEGTVAHAVLEAGILSNAENATQAIANSVYCMTPDVFDNDFKAAINDALDYVRDLMDELNTKYGDVVIFVERFVNPPVAAAPDEAGGFCDIAIYSPSAKRLWVIDYKHGVGIVKEVNESTQAKQYAAGFLFEDNPQIDAANVDVVTLVIIQPRAFHPDGPIREHNTTPAEIFDYLVELDSYIERAMEPTAPLIAGFDQCRFCEARDVCPAAEKKAVALPGTKFETARDVTATKLQDPKTMDVGRISYIMQMEPFFKMWFDSVESRARELMYAGVQIPNYKMVEAQAKREWYLEKETPEQLATRLAAAIGCDLNDVYPHRLITITEAEKKIGEAFKARAGRGKKKQAAADAAQTFAYFTLKKSSGNLTIAPDEDPRPAVDKAMQLFSGIAGLIPQPPTQKE